MAIVGGHPETGIRIVLERPREGGPPWRYEGNAVTPTERFGMRAVVTEAGDVEVELAAEAVARGELALRVKTMIRAAHKHAKDEDPGAAPPRQIQRWRGGSGEARRG